MQSLMSGVSCYILIWNMDSFEYDIYVIFVHRSAIQKLGSEVFERVYSYLKQARQQNTSEDEVKEYLEKVVSRASDCFEVDQLLYFEEQLFASAGDAQI